MRKSCIDRCSRWQGAKKKRRIRYLDPEAEWRLLEEEMRYADTVRRLSRANLRRHPAIVNPHGHKLGRSGVAGAYQLDHIVPVSVCWQYRVPEENASSLRNLQVVPWFVNLSRGSGMRLERLVGVPSSRGREFDTKTMSAGIDDPRPCAYPMREVWVTSC